MRNRCERSPSQNPYQSPASLPAEAESLRFRDVLRFLVAAVRFVLVAVFLGTGLGIAACFVLSGGHAATRFYVTYALLGSASGLIGAIPAGIVVAGLRFLGRGSTTGGC